MARNFRGLSETNDYLQRKNPGVSFWEQWTYLLWLNCDEHEWHTNWMNQTDGTGQDLQCTSRTCYGVIEEWVPSFFPVLNVQTTPNISVIWNLLLHNNGDYLVDLKSFKSISNDRYVGQIKHFSFFYVSKIHCWWSNIIYSCLNYSNCWSDLCWN